MLARIVSVALVALLALPIVQTASTAAARQRSRTVTRTFGNPEPLALNTANVNVPISADRYPSEIAVDGLKGKIRDVNVRLDGFSHTYPEEVSVLLVGPSGQTAIVMADAGAGIDVDTVTLRLDDEAVASLPAGTELRGGTFRPTNGPGVAIPFNTPAPSASANAALSIFDGGNPNGTWRLFVQDEYGPTDFGAFSGGWTVEITAKVKAKKKR